jgi:hypothetical protein
VRARLLAFLEALGAAGVLAIGVLVFCCGVYILEIQPAQRTLAARESLAAADAGKTAAVQRVALDPGAAELERFYRLFPTAAGLSRPLERLHRFAAAAELQVTQADYRFEQRDAASLGAFHVSLPVRGTYAQLRRFLDLVLRELPVASIEALRFERKKPGDTQLEAQIQLAIFFRQ